MLKCLIFNMDRSLMLRRPLGGHRIAHYLRLDGWDVEVIDFASFWSIEQLRQLAKQRFTPDVKWIGLSFLFNDQPFDTMCLFMKWVKENYPHIKIIVGGPAKFKPDVKEVDYNIHGFGEIALAELLKYLFSNGPVPRFSLFTNSGKNISANESYPAYPMSSLNVIYEDRDFIQPDEWLGVEFARGCKFQCAFCNFPVLGVKGDYSRDAEDFEIQVKDAYDRFGVSNYYVADETFNDRTEKITKFANVVEKLGFQTFFTAFLRADLLVSRPQDKEELLRMNMLGHFYGVETFNRESGKIVGKGMDTDRLKQGILDLRDFYLSHGTKRYRAMLSFISGLPKETIESLYETRDWLRDNWQGQSYAMFPVEISSSEYDSPSKFSLNWKKYGYTDASVELANFKSMHHNVVDTNHTLMWKNDYMNFKEAHDIAQDIESMKWDKQYDFRLGNYALIKLGLPSDLDERLSLRADAEAFQTDPVSLVQEYINKKLGI